MRGRRADILKLSPVRRHNNMMGFSIIASITPEELVYNADADITFYYFHFCRFDS